MPRGKGWQIRMKRVEEGGRLSCWLSLRKRICPAAGAAGSCGGKFHPQGCLYKYLRLKGGNKMKHRLKRSLSLLCALAMLVGMMPMSALAVDDGVEPYAAGDTTPVADDATLTSWAEPEGDSLADSSRDTGRIWTDKSVSKENVTLTVTLVG